jgi:hypothetical protein
MFVRDQKQRGPKSNCVNGMTAPPNLIIIELVWAMDEEEADQQYILKVWLQW